jgi:hypothetical protein
MKPRGYGTAGRWVLAPARQPDQRVESVLKTLSKRDIIRCLKRYVARELLPQIKTALADPDPKPLSIAA